jgi:UDP-glucose 4-epimerase
MGKFLVTGAAGFIGSKVAEKLQFQGHFVVTIDNLSTGYESAIPKGVIFINGDCQDIEIINKLKEYKFDAIFHIAGQSSGEISFDDPVYDLQTNTQSTLLLLKYCLETGCKRFIYASTMSVYGDQEVLPVHEYYTPMPKSLYGVGKLASEHYLRIYAQYGVNTTALRLFNVYGPGQNLQNMRQGMVSIFLAQALKQGSIHVKGSSDRFRDFIYIDDVVDAFIRVGNLHATDAWSCFNVCSGIKTSVGELVDTISGLMKEKISVRYEGSTPGDQFGITGSFDCLNKQTGWQPTQTLKDGLEKMVNWAKDFI